MSRRITLLKILDAFNILVRIFRFDHLVSGFCETLIDRLLVTRKIFFGKIFNNKCQT